MYARVSRFEIPKEQLDKDVAGVEETQETVSSAPGSLGLYYFVDRESGKTMAVTLWESEQAMRDTETDMSELRRRTSSAVAGRIVAVERHEVVTQPANVRAGGM